MGRRISTASSRPSATRRSSGSTGSRPRASISSSRSRPSTRWARSRTGWRSASSRRPRSRVSSKPGQTVIEATSGNTGIGLAMVCAAKGYPLVITMAEPFSVERRKLMRFLGAKVVITPAAERAVGMINKTIELAETHGWFMTRQFENEANPDYPLAHHGARDHRRFRRRAARLLGDRLRHRRHAEGRRARAQEGAPGDEDRRLRARPTRRCSAAASSRRAMPDGTPAAPHPPSSRIRCRAGRRTSSRSSPATRSR